MPINKCIQVIELTEVIVLYWKSAKKKNLGSARIWWFWQIASKLRSVKTMKFSPKYISFFVDLQLSMLICSCNTNCSHWYGILLINFIVCSSDQLKRQSNAHIEQLHACIHITHAHTHTFLIIIIQKNYK